MIIQNTDEWLEWRRNGIGASDAPIIMGVSKFKTANELWNEKTSNEVKKNEDSFITEKGHKLEKIARQKYELQTFMDWKPELAEHRDYPFLRASLDGLNAKYNAFWECKYMGKESYEKLKNTELKPRDRIPKQYYPQLMHQVLVTGFTEIHFTGIIDHQVNKDLKKGETEQFTLVYNIDADDITYIEKDLLPTLLSFWDAVKNRNEIKMSENDTLVVKDAELKRLLTQFKRNKKLLDKYIERDKTFKTAIFNLAQTFHNRVECDGHKITITKSKPKETFDYERYCKENKIDMTGYIVKSNPKTTKKISLHD